MLCSAEERNRNVSSLDSFLLSQVKSSLIIVSAMYIEARSETRWRPVEPKGAVYNTNRTEAHSDNEY